MAFLDIGDGPLAVFAALHKVQELGAVGGRSKEFRLLVLDVLGIFFALLNGLHLHGRPAAFGKVIVGPDAELQCAFVAVIVDSSLIDANASKGLGQRRSVRIDRRALGVILTPSRRATERVINVNQAACWRINRLNNHLERASAPRK